MTFNFQFRINRKQLIVEFHPRSLNTGPPNIVNTNFNFKAIYPQDLFLTPIKSK